MELIVKRGSAGLNQEESRFSVRESPTQKKVQPRPDNKRSLDLIHGKIFFAKLSALGLKNGAKALNILLGILKYPPDYAGDGLRLHRTFLRLQKKRALNQVYVLTSWDQTIQKKNEILDGIFIRRQVECTLKPKFGRFKRRVSFPFQILQVAWAYARCCRKIDLVLTSGSGWLPSLMGWLAFLTGKPLVKEIVLLGSDDPLTIRQCKAFWYRWFFILPFRFAKLIIAISPALEEACLKAKVSKEKIWCRFNPVDFEMAEEKDFLKKREEPPLVLWVGTVSPRKNVLFLLQSAHHFKKPVRVWFVGPCADKTYLEQLEEVRKEIPPHVDVQFLGQVEDRNELRRLYSKASLFWFASKKEGMGNVVAEALVCGTPVLALPVMGIMKQVIPSEEDGEVIDTQAPEEFAAAASRWLEKKIDRKAISKRAQERFNTANVDAQYIRHLETIVQRNKNPRAQNSSLEDHPFFASGRV